eukprot:jgi/Ulvmu1/7795/UM004_0024.1
MIFFVYGVVPGIPSWLHIVLVVMSVVTQLLPFIIGRWSDERSNLPESNISIPWTQVPVSLAAASLVSVMSVVGTCASIILLFQKIWGRTDAEGSRRAADVSAKLQKLPVQYFYTREQLMGKSVKELKDMAEELAHGTDGAAEKSALVDALLAAGGSSACTCAVCFEDYEPGDAMRVLPCLHRFHLSCIDQWILRQARQRSNTPQTPVAYECPLCHARL